MSTFSDDDDYSLYDGTEEDSTPMPAPAPARRLMKTAKPQVSSRPKPTFSSSYNVIYPTKRYADEAVTYVERERTQQLEVSMTKDKDILRIVRYEGAQDYIYEGLWGNIDDGLFDFYIASQYPRSTDELMVCLKPLLAKFRLYRNLLI